MQTACGRRPSLGGARLASSGTPRGRGRAGPGTRRRLSRWSDGRPWPKDAHLTEDDVRERAGVAVIGDQVRETLFAGDGPDRKRGPPGPLHLLGRRRPARRGDRLGQSQDDVGRRPDHHLHEALRHARTLEIDIRAKQRPRPMPAAQEEAALLLKIRRGLKPWDEARLRRRSTSEQLYSSTRTSRRGSTDSARDRVPEPSDRRHRHHEHHARLGHRAHAGDRNPQGGRRAAARHRDAVPGGVGYPRGLGRASVWRSGQHRRACRARGHARCRPAFDLWSVLVGLLLASSVGLFFGIYPAWRASRLVPGRGARAMRSERPRSRRRRCAPARTCAWPSTRLWSQKLRSSSPSWGS